MKNSTPAENHASVGKTAERLVKLTTNTSRPALTENSEDPPGLVARL